MQVKLVSYRRLWNLGNYENINIELVAEVQPDEDPKRVIEQLQKEVDEWKALQPRK